MKQKLISNIMQGMLRFLNNLQLIQLQIVLENEMAWVDFSGGQKPVEMVEENNEKLTEAFPSSKRVEGCSEKSLKYYRATIEAMLRTIQKRVQEINTDDLRDYLTKYQNEKNASRVTIDNIRRILSSYFSWLEDEDYILKSPVRRIHKVKSATTVKETYTDEALEKMRDNCENLRDLALIDILASTGMRVGELVLLNREDINFNERECIVFGKYWLGMANEKMWVDRKLADIVEFNPRETMVKGKIAKKVSMDKLRPFCRDIAEFDLEVYSGGTKFRNGDTIIARITSCLENGKTAKVDIFHWANAQ